ncbi:MAG TPA: SGNH/GDSL hydrolase family protein [Solirubrobacteraceae bacterium]|nr:SGNH/GDSL hydrolase family protein [Solirubrobacteraceae bacterium]
MARRLTSERGQSTVEWGGLLVLIALVIAALITSGVLASVANGVGCNVTKILGGSVSCADGQGHQAPDPSAPWNSSSPVTRATWGTYVSLGDSYSAGEGLGDYEPGSHVDQSQCRVSVLGHCVYHKDPKVIDGCDRSSSAYNSTVGGAYHFSGGKQTWACSGSITRDIYDGPGDPNCSQGHASGSYGEGCQVDRVNANTSLVTMTIGGNDAGFANDLKNCYMAERPGGAHEAGCTGQQSAIDGEINDMGPRLVAALEAIKARAPHARIIILTYPRPFPENPTQTGACLTLGVSVASYHLCLSPGDQRFLNDEAAKLDTAVCSAAESAGVGAECVNAYNAFAGCEMTDAHSCLQAPTAHISGSTVIGINSGAYHPTAQGQQILGALINHEISNPPPGVGGGH